MSILVTGATGTVGGSLVRQLVQAGQAVRAITRNPGSTAAAALPKEVEVVRGDYSRPESLVPTFAGVERMFLVSVEEAAEPAVTAQILGLAGKAGVRRVVHLGHDDESRDDDDPYATGRGVKRAVENSGLEWTHFFPGEFMANTYEWAASIQAEGVVRAPFGDWTSNMIHEADIAAMAMAALLEEGHMGRTYRPVGPLPVRRRDAVRMIGEALGRDVRFLELTPDGARAQWTEMGYPPEVIEWFLELGKNQDMSGGNVHEIEEVTGRKGRTFAEWVVDHADGFR
ncbi:NmrA family NAD(P)-binding protein [Rhizohabitans arisaemae]|uniref:NmrA family NAD(P)-binding protein n=1 Tax=Rhizohabitans arisaemae TaxID=2720610 RepID=UPI0024B18978|nr:NmrA family NAD(P)-binding protein [Rhizohabitans arisaemae]